MKRLTILFFLVALTACSTQKYTPIRENEPITIYATSDLHYIDPSLTGEQFDKAQTTSDGKLSIYIDELTGAMHDRVIQDQPHFLIITGDLTFNGEKISHNSLAAVLKSIKDKGIYPLVIPGNHDILNAHAIDYSKEELYYTPYITAEDFKNIYNDFGYSDASSTDETSLSYLFKVNDQLWFFMLDSNTYDKNNMFAPSSLGRIKDETIEWMDNELKRKASDTNVIIFMHHPLYKMTSVNGMEIENAPELTEVLHKYNISMVFSGHLHAQNYIEKDGITNFSLASLSVYDHHINRITIDNDRLTLKTVSLDLEAYAKDKQIDDPFFDNFADNAFAYFQKYSTVRMNQQHDDDISDELFAEIIKLKGAVNCYEFAGKGHLIDNLINDSGLKEEVERYRNSYTQSIYDIKTYFNKDATKFDTQFK